MSALSCRGDFGQPHVAKINAVRSTQEREYVFVEQVAHGFGDPGQQQADRQVFTNQMLDGDHKLE